MDLRTGQWVLTCWWCLALLPEGYTANSPGLQCTHCYPGFRSCSLFCRLMGDWNGVSVPLLFQNSIHHHACLPRVALRIASLASATLGYSPYALRAKDDCAIVRSQKLLHINAAFLMGLFLTASLRPLSTS